MTNETINKLETAIALRESSMVQLRAAQAEVQCAQRKLDRCIDVVGESSRVIAAIAEAGIKPAAAVVTIPKPVPHPGDTVLAPAHIKLMDAWWFTGSGDRDQLFEELQEEFDIAPGTAVQLHGLWYNMWTARRDAEVVTKTAERAAAFRKAKAAEAKQ